MAYRLFWVLLCGVSSVASAAGTGPEIAFSLSGGRGVYLVNPDGTGQRLIYRSEVRTTVHAIDLRPDGGEVSFEEVAADGQTASLKTVSYGATGGGTLVRSIAGGRFSVDYHPSGDGSLLYVDWDEGRVRHVAAGASAGTLLPLTDRAVKVAWISPTEFLFAGGGQIKRAAVTSTTGTVVVGQDCVVSIKPFHATAQAFVTVASPCGASLDRLNVDPPSLSKGFAPGEEGSPSPDDICFVAIVPSGRSKALTIRRMDGDGQPFQIGRKRDYASVDWRAESGAPASCPVTLNSAFQFREVN